MKEARLESGQFVSGAALIEQIGNEKKLLRVSLPLGIRIIPGARVFIDNEAVKTLPPLQCMASICFTDFEVAAEFIAKLKQGNQLRLEGVDLPGYVATWPLMEFATAFDGAPTDPKKFEEEQRRLQDQLLKIR